MAIDRWFCKLFLSTEILVLVRHTLIELNETIECQRSAKKSVLVKFFTIISLQ